LISDIVEVLKKQGVNIIPVLPKSKKPSVEWKKYQSEKFTGEIPDGYNYAVLGGDISKDLIIIDLDHVTDPAFIDKVIPNALKETLVVRTGRGGFHIYLFADKHCKSFNFDSNGVHFDIQAEGKYVIGAGSTHENGNQYEIISDTKFIKSVTSEYFKSKLSYFFDNQEGGLKLQDTDYNKVAKEGAKEGSRHVTAVKLANHFLFSDKADSIETLEYVMNDWNKSTGVNLPQSELIKICQDAYSRWLPKEDGGQKGEIKEGSVDGVADDLMNEYFFRTLKDTREILVYQEGIYVIYGEQLIEEEAEKRLEKPRLSAVREVVNLIRRRTMIDREVFDNDVDVLNLQNGLFNIKTGEFKDHTPEYMSRIKLNINYDPLAKCPLIDKFLNECLPDDDQRLTALEAAAYCLLKDASLEKAFMFIGDGANGKSTFLNIIDTMLGKLNVSNVSIHEIATNRFARAELDGKLSNIYADIESNELVNLGIIKMIISGDPITVDRKNQAPFKMNCIAKLLFSANRFPRINDESLAFFRRFIIIEWLESFADKPDVGLKEKLIESSEISGFFNQLIKVAADLKTRGNFRHPPNLDDLRKKWEEYAEPLQKYCNEELVYGAEHEIEKEVLFNEYFRYCKINKVGKESKTTFGKYIKELTGVTDGRRGEAGSQLWIWKGITLPKFLRDGKQEAIS